MIKQELKKIYRRVGLSRGLVVGLIILMIFLIIPVFYAMPILMFATGFVGLIILLICCLAGFIFGSLRYKNVEKRINALEEVSGPIDSDLFEHIALEMSVGDRWLVYHKGLDWRFWTKNTIGSVEQAGENMISIADINSNGKSRMRVSTNLNIVDVINNWIQPYQMN